MKAYLACLIHTLAVITPLFSVLVVVLVLNLGEVQFNCIYCLLSSLIIVAGMISLPHNSVTLCATYPRQMGTALQYGTSGTRTDFLPHTHRPHRRPSPPSCSFCLYTVNNKTLPPQCLCTSVKLAADVSFALCLPCKATYLPQNLANGI
jgi:hypothetical protein